MTQTYDPTKRLFVDDDGDHLRSVRPAERARVTDGLVPQQAARSFLVEHADAVGIDPVWLSGAALGGGFASLGDALSDHAKTKASSDIELRLSEEKPVDGLTTVGYQQTWRGIRVWGAGAGVSLRTDRLEVAGVNSTCFATIEVHVPSTREGPANPVTRTHLTAAMGITARLVKELHAMRVPTQANGHDDQAKATRRESRVQVVAEEVVVFRYDAATRLSDVRRGADPIGLQETEEFPFPGKVPPAPDVTDGSFRLARELIVRLAGPSGEPVTWRAVVDIETGGLLYLRALAANVTGMVLDKDPFTMGSTAGPTSSSATLNALRTSVTLQGLSAPPSGSNQSLTGGIITITDVESPTVAPPTRPVGSSFDYDARTDEFGAVNCYVHTDDFFRVIESLGFARSTYFDGTTFPTRVDHRGSYDNPPSGVALNASCYGNGTGGIGYTQFQLADASDAAHPLNIGVDPRIVMHELGGHGILYDHVNAANLGFAHSVGDSFAAILSDPDSLAPDRFMTFPWLLANRRHDRAVGAGWGFGGSQDLGGYNTEQILSTTHFRIYRSLGGDSPYADTRRFAARVTAHLLLAAVGTLTPSTNPGAVAGWITALRSADAADWTAAGLAGGAYGKVITWAFEKQGVNQAPGSPVPVSREGVAPAQDVYIDDGRHGEYQYQPVHWENQNVWNRRYADAGTLHEDPWLNRTNYAYTRVRNRGTQTATGVVVKAYNTDPGAGLVWPDNWRAMTTAQLNVPDIPPGGEVVVGPFSWTPTVADHECLLMIATSSGDPSNVSSFGAGESIAEWRLVPHDNNCAQRNVHPIAAGAGLEGIVAELEGRSFAVHNPFDDKASIEVQIALPAVLSERGWDVVTTNEGGSRFALAPGTRRQVTLSVKPGKDLSAEEVRAAEQRDVLVSVTGNGILMGGMTYRLDPDRLRPMPQGEDEEPKGHERDGEHEHGPDHGQQHGHGPDHDGEACAAKAKDLLTCLNLPVDGIGEVRVKAIQVEIDLDC